MLALLWSGESAREGGETHGYPQIPATVLRRRTCVCARTLGRRNSQNAPTLVIRPQLHPPSSRPRLGAPQHALNAPQSPSTRSRTLRPSSQSPSVELTHRVAAGGSETPPSTRQHRPLCPLARPTRFCPHRPPSTHFDVSIGSTGTLCWIGVRVGRPSRLSRVFFSNKRCVYSPYSTSVFTDLFVLVFDRFFIYVILVFSYVPSFSSLSLRVCEAIAV